MKPEHDATAYASAMPYERTNERTNEDWHLTSSENSGLSDAHGAGVEDPEVSPRAEHVTGPATLPKDQAIALARANLANAKPLCRCCGRKKAQR